MEHNEINEYRLPHVGSGEITDYSTRVRSYYRPAQFDLAATVADGYDNNFRTLDTAVSDLETSSGSQQQQLDTLVADLEQKAYTTDVDAKDAATLASAQSYAQDYTDCREIAILQAVEAKDTAAMAAATTYADQAVAALVNGSPEALDTLNELAEALGSDPNFSATVMDEIGQRVKTSDLDSVLDAKVSPIIESQLGDRLAAKADITHRHGRALTSPEQMGSGSNLNSHIEPGHYFCDSDASATEIANKPANGSFSLVVLTAAGCVQLYYPYKSSGAPFRLYTRTMYANEWSPWYGIYDTGNFDPAATLQESNSFVADLNYIKTTGICKFSPSTANRPFEYGVVMTIKDGGTHWITQMAYCTGNSGIYYRNITDAGSWTAWRELWHTGNFDPASKAKANTTGLAAGVDLNTIFENGFYDTANATNAPIGGWIYMSVIRHTGEGGWVSQTVHTLGASNNPSRIFHRNGMNVDSWSPWVELWHTGNFDPNGLVRNINGYNGDVDDIYGTFVGKLYGAINAPYDYYSFLSFGVDVYRAQFNAVNNELQFRSANAMGVLLPWVRLYHTGNSDPGTVVNVNGGARISTWTGTEAQYNAIGSKDPNTLYYIL